MKTIRTIIATLSGVLLAFALVAWFSVRRNAAFIQRTIYQGFDQTFVVALVMGCAFLLIAVILTVAIVSTDDDDEEDEEEEEVFQPRQRPRPHGSAPRGEQPYRRVSKSMEQSRPHREEDVAFARPKVKAEAKPVKTKTEPSAVRKREKAVERPEYIAMKRGETPVKKERKANKPEPLRELAEEEELETVEELLEELPEAEETVETTTEAAEAVEAEPEEEAETVEEEPEEAPDEPEPQKEEGTVRCVFCGTVFSRDSQVCPSCGKKR